MMCLLLLLIVISCSAEQYKDYQTLAVGPLQSEDDVSFVNSIIDQDDRLQQVVIVSELPYVGGTVHLLVAPDRVQSVKDSLNTAQLQHHTLDTDQSRQLHESQANNRRAQMSWSRRRTQGAPEFYMTGDQINDWMQTMAESYPEFVSYNNIGTSINGRSITGLVINATSCSYDAKHIFIHAGIHAREWITHATLIYVMNELITSKAADAADMREHYVWHLYPNVNPDGYYITHTEYRYWRKNARVNNGSACRGVDLNRNFDIQFGGTGSSPHPCSQIYHGAEAFSEPETQAIRDALLSLGGQKVLMYVDLHSYSQLLLLPYGSNVTKPDDYEDMRAVGDAAAAAIFTHGGKTYQVGTPPDILYPASGGTMDWVKGVVGVKYTLVPELRPSQNEIYGFDLPTSYIAPTGREMFAGIVAALREAERRM